VRARQCEPSRLGEELVRELFRVNVFAPSRCGEAFIYRSQHLLPLPRRDGVVRICRAKVYLERGSVGQVHGLVENDATVSNVRSQGGHG
jgi:hypothetical protein